jgi:hypothetical protein
MADEFRALRPQQLSSTRPAAAPDRSPAATGAIASVRPGTTFTATVVERLAGGRALFETDGGRFEARTNSPLRAGERVALEVTHSGRLVVLARRDGPDAAAGATSSVAIDRAVASATRALLPRQQGFAPLLATLSTLSNATGGTPSLSPSLSRAVAAFLAALPGTADLTDPKRLAETLQRAAGEALDARLSRDALRRPGADGQAAAAGRSGGLREALVRFTLAVASGDVGAVADGAAGTPGDARVRTGLVQPGAVDSNRPALPVTNRVPTPPPPPPAPAAAAPSVVAAAPLAPPTQADAPGVAHRAATPIVPAPVAGQRAPPGDGPANVGLSMQRSSASALPLPAPGSAAPSGTSATAGSGAAAVAGAIAGSTIGTRATERTTNTQARGLPPLRGGVPVPQGRVGAPPLPADSDQLRLMLVRQAAAVLARQELLPLAAIPRDGDDVASRWLELPVLAADGGIDVLGLRLTREAPPRRQSGEAEHVWRARLAFDLPGLGPMQVVVSLAGGDVSTRFRSADGAAVERVQASLQRLHEALTGKGLSVGELVSTQGTPEAGDRAGWDASLLSERA